MTDHRSGFRLTRLELYNWGTFDQRVWTLSPDGGDTNEADNSTTHTIVVCGTASKDPRCKNAK